MSDSQISHNTSEDSDNCAEDGFADMRRGHPNDQVDFSESRSASVFHSEPSSSRASDIHVENSTSLRNHVYDADEEYVETDEEYVETDEEEYAAWRSPDTDDENYTSWRIPDPGPDNGTSRNPAQGDNTNISSSTTPRHSVMETATGNPEDSSAVHSANHDLDFRNRETFLRYLGLTFPTNRGPHGAREIVSATSSGGNTLVGIHITPRRAVTNVPTNILSRTVSEFREETEVRIQIQAVMGRVLWRALQSGRFTLEVPVASRSDRRNIRTNSSMNIRETHGTRSLDATALRNSAHRLPVSAPVVNLANPSRTSRPERWWPVHFLHRQRPSQVEPVCRGCGASCEGVMAELVGTCTLRNFTREERLASQRHPLLLGSYTFKAK